MTSLGKDYECVQVHVSLTYRGPSAEEASFDDNRHLWEGGGSWAGNRYGIISFIHFLYAFKIFIFTKIVC